MKRFLTFTLFSLVAAIGFMLVFSPIDPLKWDAPDAALSPLSCAKDNPGTILQASTLVAGLAANPDGLAMENGGMLYASSPNGIILQVDLEAKTAQVAGTAKDRFLTGLALSADTQTLYATDEQDGTLYRFDNNTPNAQGELLVDSLNGKTLRWANDVTWTPTGPVFTTSSQSRGLEKFFEETAEHNGTGQLILYNETTEQAQLIADNLHMANGVAWAGAKTVLVAETTAYRVVKIDWENQSREIIADNLPGFPGNIRAAIDRPGIYWLTLISPRNNLIDSLDNKPLLRRLLVWLPASIRPAPTAYPCVIEMDLTQNPPAFQTFRLEGDGPMPSFSTVIEQDGALYLSPAGLAGVNDRRIMTATLPQAQD